MSSSQPALQAQLQIAPAQAQVERLEQLLGKIFNDEIERALEGETSSEIASLDSEMDFSPFFDDVQDSASRLETLFGQSELKSIISDDDDIAESRKLSDIIEAQRVEIVSLRSALDNANQEVRLQNLTLAAKEDQLKYLPELFCKALSVSELSSEIETLKRDLYMESEAHARTAQELNRILESVEVGKSRLWVRIAAWFGLKF